MAFKDRVHLLSDQLEGDAPIAWRKDWPSLLALSLVTLLTGPWPVLALWVQRWNVRTLWDAKDHWEGTKQFAVTFVIIGILSVIAFIRFQPTLSVLGPHNNWSWLFYHTLFWWYCWALLTPTFALIAERIDPRTQRIRRMLLPQELLPAPQPAASDKAVTQSSGKKKAARPKKKGRPVPLGILLAEEKAEMERRRTQINYIQPSSPSHEGIEASPAASVSPVTEISVPLPAETASPPEPPKSKKQPERWKLESLDNLF